MPCKPILSALLGAFAAAAASAQQADAVRKPTFVRVLGPDGGPLARASVTLAGGVPHLGAELSPRDVLVVASDERGRATAKLLPGLCYVAWAVGPADAEGVCATSPVAGYFGAGSLLEVRCTAVGRARRLRCAGADAWPDAAPLRYFAVAPFPGDEVELVAAADGGLVVPPGPFATIEVRTKAGQPLWSTAAAADLLDLPPPKELAVRVVDENGAGLGNAVVRHRVARRAPWRIDGFGGVADGVFRDLGTTGADGRVRVVVPSRGNPLQKPASGDLLLFAEAPGRPAVAGGVFGNALYRDDRRIGEFDGDELVFTCRAVEPLRGQAGPVPEGTVAHLAAVCKMLGERTSYTHDPRSFTAPVAADGTFAFTDVPAELHSSRLTLVPPPGSRRLLPLFPALPDRQLPAEVAVLPAGRRLAPARPEVADLRLRVTEPDGGPARGTVAFLAPGDLRGVLLRDSLVRQPLDAAGGGTLALVPGAWVLLVVSGEGFGAVKLDLSAGEQERSLALQPLARLRVRLRDADGQPIRGAVLQSRGSRTSGSGDPVDSLLQSYATNLRNQWPNLRTDAEGCLTISFVPFDGVKNRAGLVWGTGATEDFAIEPNDVVLELRPR